MKKIIYVLTLCLLLVGCSKKELNLEEINTKLKETNLFSETEKIEIDYLELKYGLNTEGITEHSIYMSKASKKASMYAIFKIENENAKENIKKQFIEKYVSSWTNIVYDAEQADLVNNIHTEKYGDYVIYIISEDNNKVLNIIKG